MKRRVLFWAILPLLVCALAGVSQAWQGRMGGMGDPYGLISDESDFLIHPAKIATGEGIIFYGGYRFTYRDMFDSDIEITTGTGPVFLDLSGDEMRHDALVGAGFPLGPGRMGVFFTYGGRGGDYDGEYIGVIPPVTMDLKSDLDDFSLRVLYGLPIGSFRLGGELGFAYRQEEHESMLLDFAGPDIFVNWWAFFSPVYFALPSFAPYDSAYWEIPAKLGVEGMLGPVDVEFTLRGAWIVAGDNTLKIVTPGGRLDADGDVQGWRVGGDLWVRYPLAEDLSMPVLVRVDYQDKERDGDYQDPLDIVDTNTKEQTLDITMGSGIDWEPAAGTRVGAGIYYSYLQHNADFRWEVFEAGDWWFWDHTDWPDSVEHRGTLVLAGEKELSSMVTLCLGLSGFFGWTTEGQQAQYLNTDMGYYLLIDYPMDGFHWGIGASLGATIRFAQFALEPFLNGGYQSLELSGDGSFLDLIGMGFAPLERDESRNQWSIGGGLSILFDLP